MDRRHALLPDDDLDKPRIIEGGDTATLVAFARK
jgi:hypothetical protein